VTKEQICRTITSD